MGWKRHIPMLFLFATLMSCVIHNTKPEECKVIQAEITAVSEGTTYDIVFHDTTGDFYYINRGVEQGLKVEELRHEVVNKTVTLHLAKVLGGKVTSEHISQLAVGEKIIYTEFEE